MSDSLSGQSATATGQQEWTIYVCPQCGAIGTFSKGINVWLCRQHPEGYPFCKPVVVVPK